MPRSSRRDGPPSPPRGATAAAARAPRSPRTRLDPELRRAEVLDHAAAVFAAHGFAGTTFADVAARAGLSKGAVFHYFESKEQLFEAVVQERLVPSVAAAEAAVAADPSEAPEPDALVEQLLARAWDTLALPGNANLAMIALLEAPRVPAVGDAFYRAVVVRGRRAFHAALARAVSAGRLPADLPVDALSWTLPPAVVGAVMLMQSIARLQGGAPDGAFVRRSRASYLALLMAGLRAGAGEEPGATP